MKQLLLVGFLFPFTLFAQQLYYPLNSELNQSVNAYLNQHDNSIHSTFKPLLQSDLVKVADFDSIIYQQNKHSNFITARNHPKIWRKIFTDDLVSVKKDEFQLIINPVFNFKYEKPTPSSFSVNTRGVMVKGNIGTKISFYSSFYENQAFFPDYIDQFVTKQLVVPGQGAAKTFNKTGRDFSRATGYISITPVDKTFKLNIQFGHDKHFVGEGYRSLLLSDNTNNYPFIKFTANYKRFQYVSMFAEFQDFKYKYFAYHYRKYATFNYLSWLPFNKLELGLFESIVWQSSDAENSKHLPVLYFDPVILTRLLVYGLNDNNNAQVGINLKYKPFTIVQLYGQAVVDDIQSDNKRFESAIGNKYGFQAGIKLFDLYNYHFDNHRFFVQAEYNYVSPYTYGNQIVTQNYSHYNQPLAHPLGAGFTEFVAIARYEYGFKKTMSRNFILELQYSKATMSSDTADSHFGSNIFISDLDATNINNSIGQGIEAKVRHINLKCAYLINPRTNMQIYIGLHNRLHTTQSNNYDKTFVFFGIATSLDNYYYDF